MVSLTEIFNANGCDKGTEHGDRHDYGSFYEMILSPLREEKITLLEYGVLEGASARSWLEYLPLATIYGVDCTLGELDESFEPDPRLHLFEEFGADFIRNTTEEFDVIIDDADHGLDTQCELLSLSWDRLKNGGTYIIEDLFLGTLPWGPSAGRRRRFLWPRYSGFSNSPQRGYLPKIPQDLSLLNRSELPSSVIGILEDNSHFFVITNVSEDGGLHMVMCLRKEA